MEMRQVALYPSGSQRWTSRLIHSTRTHLMYASTLALYVINLSNYHLDILTGHEHSITGLTECDDSHTLIATSANDQTIRIWDLSRHIEVNKISTTDGSAGFHPLDITWHPENSTNLVVCGRRGTLRVYNVNSRKYIFHKLGIDQDIIHVKYNPKHPHFIFCVSADSTMIVYNLKKKSVCVKHKMSAAKLTDFAFDPLSDYYLLACFDDGRVALCDTSQTGSRYLIKSFDPDCRGLGAISWLASEPGNFITGDKYTGVIRVWNVAQSEPSKRFKVKQSGIRHFKILAKDDSDGKEKDDRIAISFADGSVGIFNRKKREMEYNTPPGHTETIFDSAFCSTDPDLFATSSYDGNVKIWNTKTKKCIENLQGEEGVVIYSLSWHPTEKRIAGALGNGSIWIWDAKNGRVLHRHKLHSSQFVFKVAWNPLDPTLLASTSKDRLCTVFREDGKVLKQYKHPNTVFGVDWSPTDKNVLATGCHDGLIRIFNISKSDSSPIQKLKGHGAAVYNVKWNPAFSNIIISGSNDNTVRVWDTEKHGDEGCKVLEGHSNNVRALSWNPEIPYIALSGSWDGTIRVWDVQQGKTLCTVPHHHADVYGLSVHPERPFIYGSTSRDTTIRFWTLEPLVRDIFLRAIISKSLSPVLKSPSNPLGTPIPTSDRGLSGSVSKKIEQSLKDISTDVEKYEKLFNFFSFPQGSADLWSLAVASLNDTPQKASEDFIHGKHIVSSLDLNAQELESIRMKKYGGGLGSASKEEQLKSAAKIYLSLGNMEKYCDILAEIGEWQKALMIAPSVSGDYWKQLMGKYIEFMKKEDPSEDFVSLFTATGRIDELIEHLSNKQQYKKASIVALRNAEGIYPSADSNGEESKTVQEAQYPSYPSSQMLHVSQQRAQHHLKLGEPIAAACCHLSIDQTQDTIRCLMKGDEVLHSYALAQVFGLKQNDAVYTSMARLCEKFSLWDLGVEMLKQVQDQNAVTQFMCTVSEKSSYDDAEMEKLFVRSGIQSPDFYKSQASDFESSDPIQAIRFYALGNQNQAAVDLANHIFHDSFSKDTWDWKQIEECMRSAQCINAKEVSEESRDILLGYTNFVGFQRAMWRGYYSIAPQLIINARKCSKKVKLQISSDYMDYMLCVAHSKVNKVETLTLISQVEQTDLSSEIKEALSKLKEFAENTKITPFYKNIVIPTGSTLPTRAIDGGRTRSFITKKGTGSPLVTLDNDKSISLGEALMWHDVNKFSPTMSGEKLHL